MHDEQEHEQGIAMGLARRAYLYGVYRVVFGGGLTREGISLVFSQRTIEALRNAEALLEGQGVDLASRELTSYRMTVLDCIRENTAMLEKITPRAVEGSFIDRFVDRYSKLFRIPGDLYVKRWESPYIGTKGMMFQESTLDVRRRYHEAGLKLSAEKHFPDDHIAAIMDYEACMSERAYEAYADGDDVRMRLIIAAQKDMLVKHVFPWINEFTEDVADKDEEGIFTAFAFGLAAFSRIDEGFCSSLYADSAEGQRDDSNSEGNTVVSDEQGTVKESDGR